MILFYLKLLCGIKLHSRLYSLVFALYYGVYLPVCQPHVFNFCLNGIRYLKIRVVLLIKLGEDALLYLKLILNLFVPLLLVDGQIRQLSLGYF